MCLSVSGPQPGSHKAFETHSGPPRLLRSNNNTSVLVKENKKLGETDEQLGVHVYLGPLNFINGWLIDVKNRNDLWVSATCWVFFPPTLVIPTQGHVLMFMVQIRKLSSERWTDLLRVIQLEALSKLRFCYRESLSTRADGEHLGSGGWVGTAVRRLWQAVSLGRRSLPSYNWGQKRGEFSLFGQVLARTAEEGIFTIGLRNWGVGVLEEGKTQGKRGLDKNIESSVWDLLCLRSFLARWEYWPARCTYESVSWGRSPSRRDRFGNRRRISGLKAAGSLHGVSRVPAESFGLSLGHSPLEVWWVKGNSWAD